MDGKNPRQLLPEEYRYVNEAPNLLTDPDFLKDRWGTTEFPRDRVDLVKRGFANYTAEEEKYTSSLSGKTESMKLRERMEDMMAKMNDRRLPAGVPAAGGAPAGPDGAGEGDAGFADGDGAADM